LYYTLDKEAFKTTSALHAHFYGFKENSNNKVPKGDPPPQCMVDKDWLECTGHHAILMNTNTQPFDLSLLEIRDTELSKEDLGALADLDEWEY